MKLLNNLAVLVYLLQVLLRGAEEYTSIKQPEEVDVDELTEQFGGF